MSGVVEQVLSLSGPLAYLIVGLLAFGECGTLLGLVLPGELAVMLGGVLAFEGRVSLWLILVVAVVGAVAGDTAGYELGRRYGQHIFGWGPLRRRFGAQLDRTSAYLRERGAMAVLIGRWTSIFRTLVPPMAGSAEMPYARFAVANLAGGVPWAVTFVLAGYLAGASWRQVEQQAGRASLLLLVVVALGLGLRWLARWVDDHRDALEARLHRLSVRLRLPAVADRYGAQLEWLSRRLDPRLSRGLGLTLALAVIGAGAWVLGEVVQDLVAGEELVGIDAAVARWMDGHTTPEVGDVAGGVVGMLTLPWAPVIMLLAALLCWWQDRLGRGVRTMLGGLWALVVATTVAASVTLRAGDVRFPAVGTAVAAALLVHLAALAAHRCAWTTAVRATAAGAFVVALVGIASLATGRVALSGVLAGAALGAVWAGLLEAQARVLATQPTAGAPQAAPA